MDIIDQDPHGETMTSNAKPPGLGPEYAAQFQDAAVVRAYRYREPYPEETFRILRELAGSEKPVIADLGCGPGDLTFGLSRFAERVDGVDASEGMLSEARLSGIGVDNIRWIRSSAEKAPLEGPYDLITAGDSVHWMDWDALFRSLRKWLRKDAFFAVVGRRYGEKRWWDEQFQSLIDRYSTNREFRKYDLIAELERNGLRKIGSRTTAPIPFEQSPENLIEAFHSRNGFSRDRMGARAEEFDQQARALLLPYSADGTIRLDAVAEVTWFSLD